MKKLIIWLKKLIRSYPIRKAMKKGMKVGTGCRLVGNIAFGTEPWLITIGNNVNVAHGVTFLTHDGSWHVLDTLYNDSDISTTRPIVLEDNSFVGIRAIIMPGVTIGRNSVVGAGSVVTKDVPPNSVYGGNPAKFICTIEELYEKRKAKSEDAKKYGKPPKSLTK